jgi:hypothetical protein
LTLVHIEDAYRWVVVINRKQTAAEFLIGYAKNIHDSSFESRLNIGVHSVDKTIAVLPDRQR